MENSRVGRYLCIIILLLSPAEFVKEIGRFLIFEMANLIMGISIASKLLKGRRLDGQISQIYQA